MCVDCVKREMAKVAKAAKGKSTRSKPAPVTPEPEETVRDEPAPAVEAEESD